MGHFLPELAALFPPLWRHMQAQHISSATLTHREREVLALVASGMSCRAVATELQISVLTARKHRSNLLGKTGLRNAAQLAAYAVAHGFRRSRAAHRSGRDGASGSRATACADAARV
ncbi:helix-turn-helix domain-containing protein [Cupriavidus basilensis]|uniref:response regulator transcription factor n=1 Tax=Cupriavidus basilensis TaxID=68895 RepID=UPI0009E36CB6